MLYALTLDFNSLIKLFCVKITVAPECFTTFQIKSNEASKLGVFGRKYTLGKLPVPEDNPALPLTGEFPL
uniref:Uncharacterized protein n=1 Tax=Schistosoma curassoni TaxID=6186 RepID=A0A183L364_9TREM